MAFIGSRLGGLPKDNATALQRVLYRSHMGVRLGSSAAPHREEARALFLAWEEIGPLLAYAPHDAEWQAVFAMRDLVRVLYCDTPPWSDLRASEVARAQSLQRCKAACQLKYLFYLEGEATLALANAAALGVGLGPVR